MYDRNLVKINQHQISTQEVSLKIREIEILKIIKAFKVTSFY